MKVAIGVRKFTDLAKLPLKKQIKAPYNSNVNGQKNISICRTLALQ